MGVNHFTEEEVEILRINPYVDKVSHRSITYSEAFKQHFINESKNGKLPSEIFRAADLDPTVLGRDRINSFSKRVKKMNERVEGFADLRGQHSGRTQTKERSSAEEIAYLKHRLALQDQQIEALKKRIL